VYWSVSIQQPSCNGSSSVTWQATKN
jgi:hypothetical protein